MDKTDFQNMVVFVIVFILALVVIYAIISITSIIYNNYFTTKSEKEFKEEYNKYKSYIRNEVVLNLTQPTALHINIYASPFTNNSELRQSFMQVAQTLRYINHINETKIDPEVEAIFSEIRQIAYSNGESIIDID